MKKRPPTQHEQDCTLLLDYIIKRTPQTAKDTDALLAFTRLERRAGRTSVNGKNHVLHVEERSWSRAYCGRPKAHVNTTLLAEAEKDLDSDQWCRLCVARIKKEKNLDAR